MDPTFFSRNSAIPTPIRWQISEMTSRYSCPRFLNSTEICRNKTRVRSSQRVCVKRFSEEVIWPWGNPPGRVCPSLYSRWSTSRVRTGTRGSRAVTEPSAPAGCSCRLLRCPELAEPDKRYTPHVWTWQIKHETLHNWIQTRVLIKTHLLYVYTADKQTSPSADLHHIWCVFQSHDITHTPYTADQTLNHSLTLISSAKIILMITYDQHWKTVVMQQKNSNVLKLICKSTEPSTIESFMGLYGTKQTNKWHVMNPQNLQWAQTNRPNANPSSSRYFTIPLLILMFKGLELDSVIC